MKYYSQHRQDYFLDTAIFKKKEAGIFIEVGAHNGEAFSNTCFFERFRKWKGLCVEPLPHCFQEMKTKRNCHMLNVCIADKEGEEDFLYASGWPEMLSGLVKFYSPEHLQRVESEITEYQCTKTMLKIPTMTLQSACEKFNLINIDYCSIDTEGSELQVLQSIDFSKTHIHCFSVENNYNTDAIGQFLRPHGYRKVRKLGCDEIYIKDAK